MRVSAAALRLGRRFREAGNALAEWFFAGSFYFACTDKTRLNTGEKNGGDDETRTRDLYRDREVSNGKPGTYELFQEHSVALGTVRNTYCSRVVPTQDGLPKSVGKLLK